MVQHKPTPEEQLLKLIENPDAANQEAKKKGVAKAPEKKKKAGFKFQLPKFFAAKQPKETKEQASVAPVSPVVPKVRKPKQVASLFAHVKSANLFLLAAVVAAVIYLGLEFSVLQLDEQEYLAEVSVTDQVFPSIGVEWEDEQKGAVHYQSLVTKRNPFLSPNSEVQVETEVVTQLPYEELVNETVDKARLVGISWSTQSPIAMVEDVETGRTHFLRVGQGFGKLKVQKIERERVIITYDGREAELY